MNKVSDFYDLIGQTFEFFGVDGDFFKIGDKVFEAVCDPNDGYRSYLDSVEPTADTKDDLIFFQTPVDTVVLEVVSDDDDLSGYQLRSTLDGHVWLQFGTDYTDDYYPQFVFNYQPRKSSK